MYSKYHGGSDESNLAVSSPGVAFCSRLVFESGRFILISMFNAENR